ncbi:MAG: BrnA antitoxin family protein [Alphaproteobacteria bacterium]|nr:BrnA antitoxin family protein [Alphaproteobacteria bacterium]
MNDKTDLARLNAMTDADIARAVADDPDTFIPDEGWWAKARIVMPKNKEMVTLRLDPDVIEWFKHDGKGYQTRINAVLKAFVESQEHRAR